MEKIEKLPLVSIIITCYNLEKFIEVALRSLCDQEFQDIEIIIIDDGSSDQSRTIIDTIKSDKLVKIYFPENRGANSAISYGFTIAKGKYICRFDGDDKWHPLFLKTCMDVFVNNPAVGMVYTNVYYIDEQGNVTGKNIGRPSQKEGTLENEFYEILKEYYICAPGIIAKRECWHSALPIPKNLKAVDWFLSTSILLNNRAFYLPTPLAYYRIHSDNMHSKIIVDKHEEFQREFMIQHFIKDNYKLSISKKRALISNIYFGMAEKYFGVKYFVDAKKFYLKSFIALIDIHFKFLFWRHLFGSAFPKFYKFIKAV